MNNLPYIIPNNKEITIFLEKFAQNSIYLNEEKINLLKNSLDMKYQKIIDEHSPYLNYRIEFYKKNLRQIEERNLGNEQNFAQSQSCKIIIIEVNISAQKDGDSTNFPQNSTNLSKKRKSKFEMDINSPEEKKEKILKFSLKIDEKTFESLPVGIMASYIKQVKSISTSAPYTPLDQFLKDIEIVIETNEEKLKNRVNTFYQFYNKIKKEEKQDETHVSELKRQEELSSKKKRESSESSSSDSGSSERKRKTKSKKSDKNKQKEKTKKNDNKVHPEYYNDKKDNFISKYNTGNNDNYNWSKSSPQYKKQLDIFENFRSNKSHSYNLSSIDRNLREEIQICYKCYYPGHIAKDCKFGLN